MNWCSVGPRLFGARVFGCRNWVLCCLIAAAALPGHNSLAASPELRSGLWVMQKLPANGKLLERFKSDLRSSRDLSGVTLHVPWDKLEPQAGKPDFDRLDRTIAALRDAKMKYQLCLKPGASTPEFVYTDGARPFETRVPNPHRPNYGATVKIPIPWDPVFKRDFSRIIAQLGERYSNDPLCAGVVITCANFMSAEMHLPKSPSDMAQWRALGNYQEQLLKVYRDFTDIWGAAFPNQELCLHLSKVLNLPTSFYREIVDYGLGKYPQRYAIQSCQLTGRREDTGKMTYDLIQSYRDRVHRGFQSLAALNGPDGRMGSAEVAALNLVHADAQFWELWHGDGFDPEVAGHANKVWQEAKQLGYDGYRKKLIADGKYRARR